MKKILLLIGIIFVFTIPVEAKLLPRFTQNTKKAVGKPVVSGVGVSARLRSDRRALLVNISNLNKVTALSYTLMYQTNGEDQGVSGSVDVASGNSVSRELEFGTCSSGVCRYHQNLSNMKFEVISTLSSGKQTIKRFRIKI